MSKALLIIFSVTLVACATVKRSMVYGGAVGALAGGMLGGLAGEALSPNQMSDKGNRLIGAGTGLIVGAISGVLIGKYLYQEDPDNQQLPPMIIDQRKDEVSDFMGKDILIKEVKVSPSKSTVYKDTLPNIPKELKDKVMKSYVIEHELPERIEYLDNGKTMIYGPSKVLEIGHSL